MQVEFFLERQPRDFTLSCLSYGLGGACLLVVDTVASGAI